MPEDVVASAREEVRQQAYEYAGGEERPLGGYVKALGVFGGATGVLAVAARAAGRPAPDLRTREIILLAPATHKLSRLTAKDLSL